MGCDAANNTYIRLHSDEHGICRIYQMSINEGEWKLWREGEPFPQPSRAPRLWLGRRRVGHRMRNGLQRRPMSACWSSRRRPTWDPLPGRCTKGHSRYEAPSDRCGALRPDLQATPADCWPEGRGTSLTPTIGDVRLRPHCATSTAPTHCSGSPTSSGQVGRPMVSGAVSRPPDEGPSELGAHADRQPPDPGTDVCGGGVERPLQFGWAVGEVGPALVVDRHPHAGADHPDLVHRLRRSACSGRDPSAGNARRRRGRSSRQTVPRAPRQSSLRGGRTCAASVVVDDVVLGCGHWCCSCRVVGSGTSVSARAPPSA